MIYIQLNLAGKKVLKRILRYRTNFSGTGRKSYFSVAEIVVVFFIIGLVFASVTQLLSFNLWLAERSQDRSLALTIAQNRLEHLRVLPFAGVDAYAEELVPVNNEGVPDIDGLFYRSTILGVVTDHTRPVTIIIKRDGQLRRPGFELALDTRLLDPDILIEDNQ